MIAAQVYDKGQSVWGGVILGFCTAHLQIIIFLESVFMQFPWLILLCSSIFR